MPSSTYPDGLNAPEKASVVREGDIEEAFIERLRSLKYEHRPDIHDRASLERNFREKFESLNRVTLTDAEFARLLDEIVTPDVFTASKTLRSINSFTRDDGTPLNYSLVNLKDWCKNHFEIISQLRINTDYSHHRYDVILLINGVPCVQIELKTLGVNPRRAMEQIVDYKNDPGNGYAKTLLCFMQLFIVSNRDRTYYFANNNARHFAFNADERFLPIYEFAAEDNRKITHLDEFAEHFLKKCDLGKTISRYMVLLAGEQKLMIMRPYQVYAVQHLVKCIDEDNGNGFIWHTTGSGKTLTSFKASTLLKENDHIHKCVFVVDRKDLDRQTREEFNRFQEGCVEENTNTATLVRRLLSEDYADKVIVTTIQKLGLALDEGSKRNQQRKKNDQPTYKEMLAPLSDKRIVFIFDECHRSQFGENHKAIKEFFPKAQLFGFTGTPIFEANASLQKIEDEQASMRTTVDLFQKQLHAYTITHAIEDGNVLRFHVDYFKPKEEAGKNPPKPGEALAKKAVIEAILAKHDAATGGRRFNAILATSSINDAIEYHALFQTMQAEKLAADPDFKPLNIACVFSPPAEGNPDVKQIQEDLPQEQADNEVDPEGKKAALKAILADYNSRYGTNHRLSEFDLYYQDVQKRIKDQQWPNSDFPHAHKIDITIVVDMLLTGFDSKFLNTLYVDKNLRHHGLIQAFTRLNEHEIRIQAIKARLGQSHQQLQNELDLLGTNHARSVATVTGDRTYNRTKLIAEIDRVKATPNAFILSEDVLQAKVSLLRSTEQWRDINPVNNTADNPDALRQSLLTVIQKSASNEAIAKLKESRDLESWIRTGLGHHVNSAQCEFCGSNISDERLTALQKHFSKAYEDLTAEVVSQITTLEEAELTVALPDERDLVPDLRAQFVELKTRIEEWTTWASAVVSELTQLAKRKQLSLETPLAFAVETSRASEIAQLVADINTMVTTHNQKRAQIDTEKSAAKAAIEKHQAASFYQDNNVPGIETAIQAAMDQVNAAQDSLNRIASKKAAIEAQIQQQSVAAQKINQTVQFLLPDNNISVAEVPGGSFEFRRDGSPANNLSEGEKTAITFAYFLATLENNGASLAQTIVFIDDPISSLDSNHIYAVYALITKQLESCLQIFVSTHNSELYTLLKDNWFDARQQFANHTHACGYYTRRYLDSASQLWHSTLEDTPNLLRKFKSEYQFVFEQLHLFSSSQAPTLHEAYTSPNLLRKFLEAYLGFKKPCVSQWSKKLDLLFDADVDQTEIQKFSDDASHLQGLSRALQQPNFISNAQNTVKKVIQALKAKDLPHYTSMCTVIGVAP